MEQAVKIKEADLAKHLGLNAEEIELKLRFLEKTDIIDYSRKSDQPIVTLIQSRVATSDLRLSNQYAKRKEAQSKRIDSMIRYVQSKDTCRMKIILDYFDEQSTDDCGKCDNCLKNGHIDGKNQVPIEKQILSILSKNEGLELRDLVTEMASFDQEEIEQTCRNLCAKELLLAENNRYKTNPRFKS